MHKILVVDDDVDLRTTIAATLEANGFEVEQASNGEEAVHKTLAQRYDLVLLDVNTPKMNGLEALKEIRRHDPSITVIILTAYSNIRDAVHATKQGAYNYLEKPIKAENLVYLIEKALKTHNMVYDIRHSAPIFRLPDNTEFVGQSSEMKRIFSVIDRLAQVDTNVLIRGESGTGKELVAKALHFSGVRKDNRFVTVNCSAIPENLIESEFFGHEKGAFTGADSRKIGKFQFADGGTLFLDEIGDISPAMQVKLLRVLQEKKFTPVGANREIEVNVRIVAATNRALEEMIRTGDFREDLFYRLNVLPIDLPRLRERIQDLDSLVHYFVEKFNEKYHKQVLSFDDASIDIFKRYGWPGNIRELENVIEHAFVMVSDQVIQAHNLPERLLRKINGADSLRKTVSNGQKSSEGSAEKGFNLNIQELDFQANKEAFEKQFLISALKVFKGRINQTAVHANIPKKTLLRKLEKYGINARDFSANR